ncbi:MAG: alginate lyase family protein [Lentilitoribacter sp.]
MRIVTLLLMTLLSYQFLATPFARADDSGVTHYDCGTFAEPIVEIAYGSRYTDESVTRADYDEASNAEVNKVLKPIDDFARTLVVLSNNAIRLESKTEKNTFCVVDMIYQWAKADALSVQETINVKMSIPARYGSIATALAQLDVQGDLRFMQKNLVIQQWLERRAFETIYFFDNEAPGGVPRANLRGWASLAVTQVGLLYDNAELINWGISSNNYILSFMDEDGSHPDEMRRGNLALHYQLHAAAPLSKSTALLVQAGYRDELGYLDDLDKLVSFTIAALKDPLLVEQKFDVVQSITGGIDSIKPFMLAWVEAYLSVNCDPHLDEDVKHLRPLSNSKIGGNLTLLYLGSLETQLACNGSGAKQRS